MGSLISRRKRKTKVEAKSVSVQATERSIRSSSVNNEESSEVKVTLEKAKPDIMEVNIGDGQSPCPESPPRQTTNENRKRKVGFPKSKIKPQSGRKNHSLQSKDGSTQYDVFGVPYQVIPLEAETKNTERKHKAFQSGQLKVEDISAPNDNPHQEKLEFSGEGAPQEGDMPNLPTNNVGLLESRAERQDHTSNTQRKSVSPRLQRRSDTSGSRRASQEFKGSSQKSSPPNKLDTDDKSSGLQRKAETMVESIDNNSESSTGMVNTEESPENVSHEKVFSEDQLTGMTTIISRQLLSPYGEHGSLNLQRAKMRKGAKTTLETKTTEPQTGSTTLPQPTNSTSSPGSELKKDGIDEQERKCQDNITDEESKIAETDICPDEDIDEDTLDWNVDDRVRSPLDPEKEEDSDSLSCQEVIAKSPNSDDEEGQEDLVVKGYCRGSGTSNQEEEDLAEDTLDTNVDDRIHSPSDSRPSSDHSDEEDDTIDMLVNGTLGGEPSQLCQQQSSLTTLKDGDSADNSIYTPLSKSPSRKLKDSAETESTVSKDLSCGEQHPLQEKEEHSVRGAAGMTPQGTAAKKLGAELQQSTEENQRCDLPLTVEEEHREESMTLGGSTVENGSEDANHRSLENGSPQPNQGNVDHGSSNTSHCDAGNETLDASHGNSQNRPPDTGQGNLENDSLNTNYSSMDNGPRTTSHSSLESEPQGISFGVISSSINIKPPPNETKDLAAVNNHKTTDPQRKDQTLPKEPGDFHDSPENATDSPKFENPSGKLLMNVGDGTLPHGDEDLSKAVLEVQEAEAMTLLLITGTLPCEGSDEVERGAGDGQSLDVSGAEKPDDTKDADKRSGLATTTNTRVKSSCQLEQLQAEHSQQENVYNTAPFNPQPPQRNQSTADDVSAACAIAEDQPQALPHVTIAAGQECRGRPVPVGNSPSDLIDHGAAAAAAASFVEERTPDGLVPPRRTSPGAASSERDCQTVRAEPLQQRPLLPSSCHGRLAAGASSSRPHVYSGYSEGTGAVTPQTVAVLDTDSSATFIEVHTVATTEIMAQSPRRGSSTAQQRDIGQSSNSTSQGVPDPNQALPGHGDVLNRRETPESSGREPTHLQQQPVESAPLQENSTSTMPDQQPQTSQQLAESSASNIHPDSLQHNH